MSSRMPLIDALKGVAAQVIVLHHLASYGPVAAMMNRLLPTVAGWLFDYGRMAVQVFLVIAGFLAARGLAGNGVPSVSHPGALIWRRYVRLVRPFLAAMLLAIACAAIARLWMDDEAIPDAPGLWQFLAHGLLLHGVFDVPSLSVGIWYVAVDFQLYALMLCLLRLASLLGRTETHQRALAQLLVAGLGVLALFYFNLNADLDDWAIYFFGSYALGAMAYWLSEKGQGGINPGMVLLGLVGVAALVFEYRTRIALALIVALTLGYARVSGLLVRWPPSRVLAYLGQISYSVFLVHFPVCLVVNAVFEHFTRHRPLAGVLAVLLAWGGSTLAGGIFYRLVENRKQWWPAATAPSEA
jgi:peptidoglycan/LPS O-acetylase OafA/YrhL